MDGKKNIVRHHREPIVRISPQGNGVRFETIGVEILRRPAPFGESRMEWISWYQGLVSSAAEGRLSEGLPLGAFVSINLDSWQMGVSSIIEPLVDVAQILSETGHFLGIEWTERGAAISNREILKIVRILNILHERYHVILLLDDMGSGTDYHRKMSFLTPAYGKIDGELFRECLKGNMKAASSVQSIRDLLDRVGSLSVVEWVESWEDAVFAQSIGIHAGQGFFWSLSQRMPPRVGDHAGDFCGVACMKIQSL